MNRLLAALVVIALLVVTFAIGVVLWKQRQASSIPTIPVGEQSQQQETIPPHAPKWQLHRKEK